MLQDKSETELVALYQESGGDHQYLTVLFTRHSDVVYRTAFHILKNSSDAEDVIQTAYFEMVQGLLRYKNTGSVVGWMLQVVVHNCYDRIRSEKSRKNRERKIMSERVQATGTKNYELTEMIESHLSKLPDIYKVPIALQIMEGLSIKEVSEALEIPEKTIRSQIARGLEKLKASLQRVGVTASVISIGETIKEIQPPMVPSSVKTSQYFDRIYQGKSTVSAKLAITSGSKNLAFQKIMLIPLLLIISTVLFTWFQFNKKENIVIKKEVNSIAVNQVESRQKFSKKWSFEDAKELNDFKLIRGKQMISLSNGFDKSNCLATEGDTVIELDISKFKLPIKITFAFDNKISVGKPGNIPYLYKGSYQKDKNLIGFYNLKPSAIIDYDHTPNRNENMNLGFTGFWNSMSFYIAKDYIDIWPYDNRGGVFFGESVDNKKLYFNILEKTLIDNLVIESIEEEVLPDVSNYKSIAITIPFKKGQNLILLTKETPPLHLDKTSRAKAITIEIEVLENCLGLNKTQNSEPISLP